MASIACNIIDSFSKLVSAFNSAARPYLTALVATLFNGVCVWAVINGDLTIMQYITAIGPTNGMIIGFWFGEKAALKQPGEK